MNFDPTQTIESAALPGVTFVVRRLNKIQRAQRDAKLIDARARIAAIYERMRPMLEDVTAPDGKVTQIVKPERLEEFQKFDNEVGMAMVTDLYPAYLRAGLLSISGYEIAGKPATIDSLLSDGEDALLDEIYAACVANGGLTAEQEKNLRSPGTSPEVGAADQTPTTAPAVEG